MPEAPPHNLVFETIDGLRLVASCQSKVAPTNAEWDAWLEAVRALGRTPGEFRLLVLTEGGRPTKEQRDRLTQAKRAAEREKGKRETEPRTALVSAAPGERFLVSMLVFMNPAIRCFAPSDLQDAYAHLGLTGPERELADAAVSRLRARLAAQTPTAGSAGG